MLVFFFFNENVVFRFRWMEYSEEEKSGKSLFVIFCCFEVGSVFHSK